MSIWEEFVEEYLSKVYIPDVGIGDIFEIIIIALLIYSIMVWIKDTRAWSLLKGILVILSFALVAIVFNLKTILWIASKTLDIGIIAIVIIFQPELRRALEQIGRRKIISQLHLFDDNRYGDEDLNDKTIYELTKAAFELGKTRTGALIVLERDVSLQEYENTGIVVDGVVTSELLINIFEHNTPLHDGAVIIRNNRIVAATCYLPLSDNMKLSKDLGTRHRAAIGVSEATDSLTIVVSEETGKVSIASSGTLKRNVDESTLRTRLTELRRIAPEGKSFKLWKGRQKDEGKVTK